MMATTGALILLLLLCSLAPAALSVPPRPPVRCGGPADDGCVLSNAYGAWSSDRADCAVAAVAYPESERDVVAAVARAGAGRMRVKAVSGFAHTIPRLACPGGANYTTTMLISTSRYAGVAVDAAARTVTADAGASLRAVIDAAEASGLSLPASPYWEGVSVGGLISTGSHGSSWWGRGGAVHDHVLRLTIVGSAGADQGWARVVAIEKGDELFPAAIVSLGLLGVISKVTLSLEPRFKRSITYDYRDDTTFQDDFADHAAHHEFADIAWYPSQHQAVYRIDDRAPLNATGDGVNDFIGFRSTLTAVSAGIRALETSLEKSRDVKGKCTMAKTEIAAKRLIGNGLRNGAGPLFTGYPVVGFQGMMQTSGSCAHSSEYNLLAACAWDPRYRGLFFYESTAIFSPARFRSFILDVKRLRDVVGAEHMCGVDVYNGFLVRFIKRSEAVFGQPEDSVVVDLNYYRSSDPSAARLDGDVWEEVEQMAFFKHGARPHWAKNRMVAFRGVPTKYSEWNKFNTAKAQLDPKGLFDSPWSNAVLDVGIEGGGTFGDGCALDGLCVCSKDSHCSPTQGYYCKAGRVYTEARVCRYSASHHVE